jgi:hypothetical protein
MQKSLKSPENLGGLLRRRVVVVLVVVFALAPGLAALSHWRRYYAPVLDAPIELRSGVAQSPEFVARIDGAYIMWLEFGRSFNPRRDGCLLGLDRLYGLRCAGTTNLLELSWALINGTNLSGSGPLADWHRPRFYSSDVVRRPVARFDVKADRHYVVRMTFVHDPSPLNQYRPRLVVRSLDFYDRDFQLEDMLSLVWATVVLAFGAILLKKGSMNKRNAGTA